MQKKLGLLFVVSLLAIVLLLLVGQSLAFSPQGASSTTSGFITEYPIPVVNGQPQNVIVESAGSPASVWFTMPDADAIGHLIITSTADFQFTSYNSGITNNSAPYDLAYDANRNLIWFTEKDGNQLGALDISTGIITETVLNNESPHSIAISDDGNIWFTQPEGNYVSRYSPDIDSFTYFTYTNNLEDGQPTKIAIRSNDAIWITAPNLNQIAQLKPSTGQFIFTTVGDFGFPSEPPSDIVIFDNEPWISAPTNDRIGRHILETLALFQWFTLPSTNGGIDSLAITQSGDLKYLWFTEPNYGRVGRITLNSNNKASETLLHSLAYANSVPADITVDAQNVAWIADKDGQAIAQWISPYSYKNFLPSIISSQ